MGREIVLRGFKQNNLLAFLALLGLLKTLDVARPEWDVRASWVGGMPHLHVTWDVNDAQIVDAVLEGLKTIGNMMNFRDEDQKPIKTLKITPEKFQALQRNLDYNEIVTALGSDGSIDKKDGIVEYPPLCMMLGSGKQYFLERLEDAVHVKPTKKDRHDMEDVLFGGWERAEKTQITFRWHPKEHRMHAHMSRDPSKSKKFLANVGANRLAAVGFTTYWCVPISKGLGVTACKKEDGSSGWQIFWPIWRDRKLSLDTILMLMRHPDIKKIHKQGIRDMQKRGIQDIICAKIFWIDKYRNVSWGKNLA